MSEVTKEEFEAEVHLETYDGTFDDFGAIILQYGYVNMFLLAFPVVPLLVSPSQSHHKDLPQTDRQTEDWHEPSHLRHAVSRHALGT